MGWLFTEAKYLIDYVAREVELAAAVIIAIAALEATIKGLAFFVRRRAPPEAKNAVRLSFARWLALGLEFELAADILCTEITPTWNGIQQLAAIAALRDDPQLFSRQGNRKRIHHVTATRGEPCSRPKRG